MEGLRSGRNPGDEKPQISERMDARRFAILMLLFGLVAASGCKSDPYMDAIFDTKNAEIMALEDTIFDLRFENDKLREKLKDGSSTVPGVTTDDDDGGFGPFVTPPSDDETELPTVEPPTNPDLSEPMTTPGVEVDPSEIFPDTSSQLGRGGVSHSQVASLELAPAGVAEPTAEITHLHINRSATRGLNTDGKSGDDALMIGLEPRDRYGRFVPAGNPVAVVLLDPQLQGQAARIAEWHFDAAQVAVGARHASATPMILLEAVWPKRPPAHSRLKLYARYTTANGDILQTSEMIHIDVDGQFSTRWTPRQSDEAARVATRPENSKSPEWRPNR